MPLLPTDGASIFYTDQGVAGNPPCLLIHGWTCDSHDWSFQIPVLLANNIRVVAIDLRGHGRSSAPETEEAYHFSTLADDALAVIQHLKLDPVVLVCHSMGTVIGSILAANHPNVVHALVLVHPIYGLDAAASMDGFYQKLSASPAQAPQMTADLFNVLMYEPGTPEWIKTWTYRRVLGMPPQSILGSIKANTQVVGTAIGRSQDCKTFMHRRTMPRLAICTSAQALDWEQELGLGMRDEAHLVEEGTFVHLMVPEKTNDTIVRWLKKIDVVQ